jgi:hypothetical protein
VEPWCITSPRDLEHPEVKRCSAPLRTGGGIGGTVAGPDGSTSPGACLDWIGLRCEARRRRDHACHAASIDPDRVAHFTITTPTATRAEGADTCRYGDVKALFNAWPVVGAQYARGLHTRLIEQTTGATGGPCQYRLFGSHEPTETPPIQTFTSRQFFLGGISWGVPYPLLDLTRAQAEQDLELIHDRVYIVPAVDGWHYDPADVADYEQTVLVSAFRHAVGPDHVLFCRSNVASLRTFPRALRESLDRGVSRQPCPPGAPPRRPGLG